MSIEDNKATERRFVEEGLNQGNPAVFDEVLAADLRESVQQFVTMLRSAFPDLYFTIEDMISEGDRVVTRSTWRGTHRGEFLGIPATGKQVAVTGIYITRYVGGQAVEHWAENDLLGLMQQLGAVPSMG